MAPVRLKAKWQISRMDVCREIPKTHEFLRSRLCSMPRSPTKLQDLRPETGLSSTGGEL